MEQTARQAALALRRFASEKKAEVLRRFFKTGKGQYGEGDLFIGVVVPDTRRVAKEFRDLPLGEVAKLLASKVHEDRLLALVILVLRFRKADEAERAKLHRFYLRHLRYINNWDLVDCSAEHLVGGYLLSRDDKSLLAKLAESKRLWDRRVAVVGTFHFIKNGRFEETFKLAEKLLDDEHDLMHKAIGWMLREVGKRDEACLERFLRAHYRRMPRTMLRYAIERFPEPRRKAYLLGQI